MLCHSFEINVQYEYMKRHNHTQKLHKSQTKDTKMSISHRLKTVLDEKGLSIKACAELLGMPYRTLQNYLLNARDPSADVLIKVSQTLNVNLNWLMMGEGKMFANASNQNELTEKEQELINHYRTMSNEVKNAFDVSFKQLSQH